MINIAISRFVKPAAAFMVCAILASNLGSVYAQDPATKPEPAPAKSPEVQRLEEEKAQAELRKAIAEAEKAELEARFPKPTTTPLTGTTTINDNAAIENHMVSYVQMALAAKEMIKQLNAGVKPAVTKLVIYNQNDANLLLSYKTSLNQLALIRKDYEKLVVNNPTDCPPPAPTGIQIEGLTPERMSALLGPLPVMSAIHSVFGKFIDMTALLRTNVEIKGQVFELDEAALVSEVFRAAKGPQGLSNVTLYWPAAFPPNLNLQAESNFLEELDALDLVRAYTEGLAKALEETQKKIKETEGEINSLNAKLKDLNVQVKLATDEIKRIEKTYGRVEDSNGHRRRGVPPEVFERKLKLDDTVRELQREIKAIAEPGIGKLDQARLKKVQLEGLRTCLLSRLQPEFQDANKLDDTIAKLRAQNSHFTKFVEALIKADTATGLNPLTSFIKAENLLAALKGDGSYWLQLKVIKAGGNNRIKTNLFWDIFTGGQRLSHSGGAIVEYILYTLNGEAVCSDTFTIYSEYIKANKVRKLPNP